jgi:hypothetical protein
MRGQAISPENVHRILDGLKDFQRQTVDYVFQRLYTDTDATRRFLIADEVGLGKTLVARGVIARALEHLSKSVSRLDVVYICSNADIARQNTNRLSLLDTSSFALASRITLLPLEIKKLMENPVNFVSFTPGTSFDLKSGMGMARERVLLYWLLQHAWGFQKASAYNVLRGDMGPKPFRSRVDNFDPTLIESSLESKFISDLAMKPELHDQFDELRDFYKRSDSLVPQEARQKRTRWIGAIRALLARSCLTALEPDIIILDEFQRFKHLLGNESEASELAHHLFNYSTEHEAARVILLSATPYKMYTLAHEEDDDHYRDFVQTLKFLFNDPAETERLEKLISEYRQEIFRLRDGDIRHLCDIKQEMERSLRRVMVRTERLASSDDRDGMLVHVPSVSLDLKQNDLHAYLGLAKIAGNLAQSAPLEYWKSVPYLLNFMDRYEFKNKFKDAVQDPEASPALTETLLKHPQLLLCVKDIQNYQKLDPGNARLRSLLADTVGAGVWKALWLPPAKPYYQLEGVFAEPSLSTFTKRLIFSNWRVVPKAISIFLSYEAERLMSRSFDESAKNPKEREYRPLLRFLESNERLTGMPVLGLIYPCLTLAKSIDPLRIGTDLWNGHLPTIEALVTQAEQQVQSLLQELPIQSITTGAEDERWYWAAPMLLDAHNSPDYTRTWWQLDQDSNLANEWAGIDDESSLPTDIDQAETHWDKHVKAAQELLSDFYADRLQLGRPPADLAMLLAQMSLAGLGVVSLRAMLRVTGKIHALEETKSIVLNAARIAKAFVFLFNLPENTALIRSLNRLEPYWRRVLEYCLAGGLQSVMDEYLHVLHESLGVHDSSPIQMSDALQEKICDVLTFRTSTPSIDIITPTGRITPYGMRSRFAMRFGDEKDEDGTEITRADRVRWAFNSPFWPFVLATTSIGQEGLDFHNYCHAIVHWNLPSNPVDLEQREGRVHRYKGHAVRKNLGSAFELPDLVARMNQVTDPWDLMFKSAPKGDNGIMNDLIPYWIYPVKDGAKIERHVLALPLSSDQRNFQTLQRSLAVYRMVFGQNRQEDLLTYLVARYPMEDLQLLMQELRINLAPPH